MAQFVNINDNGILEFTELAEKQYKPKKIGGLVVGIATKFLVKWARPLLVSFIAQLIRQAAKRESVEYFVEELIIELDSDGDGQID